VGEKVGKFPPPNLDDSTNFAKAQDPSRGGRKGERSEALLKKTMYA